MFGSFESDAPRCFADNAIPLKLIRIHKLRLLLCPLLLSLTKKVIVILAEILNVFSSLHFALNNINYKYILNQL